MAKYILWYSLRKSWLDRGKTFAIIDFLSHYFFYLQSLPFWYYTIFPSANLDHLPQPLSNPLHFPTQRYNRKASPCSFSRMKIDTLLHLPRSLFRDQKSWPELCFSIIHFKCLKFSFKWCLRLSLDVKPLVKTIQRNLCVILDHKCFFLTKY